MPPTHVDQQLDRLAVGLHDGVEVVAPPCAPVGAGAPGRRLEHDPDAAIGTIEETLAEARRVDYQGAVSGNLRMLALAHIIKGRHDVAARTLLELYDGLVHRGALADLRAAFHTTAVLLYRCGRSSWAQLASTAESITIMSTMAGVDTQLVQLPARDAAALPRREAIVVARRELQALRDELEKARWTGWAGRVR